MAGCCNFGCLKMVIIDAGKLPLEWENDDEVKDLFWILM